MIRCIYTLRLKLKVKVLTKILKMEIRHGIAISNTYCSGPIEPILIIQRAKCAKTKSVLLSSRSQKCEKTMRLRDIRD